MEAFSQPTTPLDTKLISKNVKELIQARHYDMMTNFILIDAKNNMYWAVTDVTERERLLPLVCEGLIYYITNFKIVPAQSYLKPIDTGTTIVLDKNTEIRGCSDGSSIPRFKFSLCSVETLKCRIGATETLSGDRLNKLFIRHLNY
ncbi:hypothetical protein POM88_047056 [Heracleum sosnowskyi]|uniref:Uncharacterized protein n=1 Tax=Heracleum sosnowskyi TaxID=360622 RepID=A0AAD8M7Q0_9APIA|nr:hypothetical protein POM88_047056 [Heracleum sosnowskyi]